MTQPSPVDSMREATFTESPKRQYLGIACPTTPVMNIKYSAHGYDGLYRRDLPIIVDKLGRFQHKKPEVEIEQRIFI